MQSCLYEGRVEHRRFTPTAHSFRRHLYMFHLDLDELPSLIRQGLVHDRKFSVASFLRSDHLPDPTKPLDESVRDLVQERTGQRPNGPIRITTQLRTFGYYFSPINLISCYDASDTRVEFLLAEVTNTPWQQTHSYVLWDGNRTSERQALTRYECEKSFHVSPFMAMNYVYRWRVTEPNDRLIVRLENWRDEASTFDATLSLRRRPLDHRNLRSILWRYPAMPAKIVAGIYIEALKLWIKGCPYHPHPNDLAAKSV